MTATVIFSLRGQAVWTPPAFAQVLPAGAMFGQRQTVTLYGSEFQPKLTVHLGPTMLGVEYISSQELKVQISESLAPGSFALRRVNPNDQSVTIEGAFQVRLPLYLPLLRSE